MGESMKSILVGKQKWGPDVIGCWRCGRTPVRQETTHDNGAKLFCYICPNEACETYFVSPVAGAWLPSRKDAAAFWNEAQSHPRPTATNLNPMIAIAAAWLDAELYMRTGDGSCKHSVRLLGYQKPK